MREISSDNTLNRFKILGKNLIDIEVNNIKDAEVVIDSFYKFFNSLGISMHVADLGVKEESIDAMVDHILKYVSTIGSHMYVNLDKDALVRILKASM
jgi:alcohol dehydrogenase YqhD (iron-dependent ADH family)